MKPTMQTNNIPKELPQWLSVMLNSCPKHGDGVHRWFFRCARNLHCRFTDKHQLFLLLKSSCQGCGRHVPDSEIWGAIHDSAEHAWTPDACSTQRAPAEKKWPTRN